MIAELALVIGAYLLGSVSSAILVCRLAGLPDPRTEGSNNPGATNVLRIGGRKAAALTLLGDMLKGLVPVVAAHLAGVGAPWIAAAGLAAFLGHLYPLFFGFKGGKGVATALGVQLGLMWQIGLTVAALWLFMAKVVRISSLSALVSMGLAPLVVWWFWPDPAVVGMQSVLTLVLFWRHRTNIRRLITGEETRIGGPGDPAA
jgi:glycerol-3-phosphate acyltransferase PlsY